MGYLSSFYLQSQVSVHTKSRKKSLHPCRRCTYFFHLLDWSCGPPPHSPWCDSRWGAWRRLSWWSRVCWQMRCRTQSHLSPSCTAEWLQCPLRLKAERRNSFVSKKQRCRKYWWTFKIKYRCIFTKPQVTCSLTGSPTRKAFSMGNKCDVHYLWSWNKPVNNSVYVCLSGVCKHIMH